MEEYEYSFEVKSIKPYIEYCKKEKYKKSKIIFQNRIVYENINNTNIIARLTTNIKYYKKYIYLDFKNVNSKKEDLKISNESIDIKIKKHDLNKILNILEILEFKERAILKRKRYIYEKNGVKFEIDEYIKPKMNVIALEGKRDVVDKVYKKIRNMEDE